MVILFFSRSSDTVLGETGDPCEVFLNYECENVTANDISSKCEVSGSLLHEKE